MKNLDAAIAAPLEELLRGVRAILGNGLVGVYLHGSLTGEDFDAFSDVDVMVVSEQEINAEEFAALQAMHTHIAAPGGYWETQLEVCYLPRSAMRRYDPANVRHPYLDRGCTQMEWLNFDVSWTIQLFVLRERGIALAGPPPAELIDPLSADDLRSVMRALMRDWLGPLNTDSPEFATRGYQSYIVLTQCRVLYTLHFGTVVSKIAAARWVQQWLDPRWVALIERALADRQNPDGKPEPAVIAETLEWLQYAQSISEI